MKSIKLLAVLASLAFAGMVHAQTTYRVNLTVTPASGNGSVTPTATWSPTPAGATSCVASGGWSGNKAASGTQVLPAVTADTTYSLVCSWPGGSGFASVVWDAPTTNSDGTPLTNLAGYRVLYGTSPTNLSQSVSISDPTALGTTISNLPGGTTYYFATRAFNSSNVESVNSNVAQKLVEGGTPPTATASATVTVNKVPSPPSNLRVLNQTVYELYYDTQKRAWALGDRAGFANIGVSCMADTRLGNTSYYQVAKKDVRLFNQNNQARLFARCG